MPAVSVIMPAYNVAPYVGDALRSALAQTFTDLEVLVVDDGSTDATADVVAGIAARDPRVRLIRQPNRGLAGARNTGLRSARGDVFALLDSDDLWEPEFLAEQVAILRAHPDVHTVTGNGWCLGGAKHAQLARPCPDPRPAPRIAVSPVVHNRVAPSIGRARRRPGDGPPDRASPYGSPDPIIPLIGSGRAGPPGFSGN